MMTRKNALHNLARVLRVLYNHSNENFVLKKTICEETCLKISDVNSILEFASLYGLVIDDCKLSRIGRVMIEYNNIISNRYQGD